MSFESCIRELAAARGKDIPKFVLEQIEAIYNESGDKNFNRIVNDLIRCDHMPSNIYGAIKSRWEEAKIYNKKSSYSKDNWESKDQCVSAEEWNSFASIILEINEWHNLGLVQKNPNGCTKPMTMEEYIEAGQPDSWSPMIDHFLRGMVPAYKSDLTIKGFLNQYLDRYYKNLVETRISRTQKNFVKK